MPTVFNRDGDDIRKTRDIFVNDGGTIRKVRKAFTLDANGDVQQIHNGIHRYAVSGMNGNGTPEVQDLNYTGTRSNVFVPRTNEMARISLSNAFNSGMNLTQQIEFSLANNFNSGTSSVSATGTAALGANNNLGGTTLDLTVSRTDRTGLSGSRNGAGTLQTSDGVTLGTVAVTTDTKTATATTSSAGAGTKTQTGDDGTTARTVVVGSGTGPAQSITETVDFSSISGNGPITETFGAFINSRNRTVTINATVSSFNPFSNSANVRIDSITISGGVTVNSFSPTTFFVDLSTGEEDITVNYAGATVFSITSQTAGTGWSNNAATIDTTTGVVSFPAQSKVEYDYTFTRASGITGGTISLPGNDGQDQSSNNLLVSVAGMTQANGATTYTISDVPSGATLVLGGSEVAALRTLNAGNLSSTFPDTNTTRTWQLSAGSLVAVVEATIDRDTFSSSFADNINNSAALTAIGTGIAALQTAYTFDGTINDRAGVSANFSIDLDNMLAGRFPLTITSASDILIRINEGTTNFELDIPNGTYANGTEIVAAMTLPTTISVNWNRSPSSSDTRTYNVTGSNNRVTLTGDGNRFITILRRINNVISTVSDNFWIDNVTSTEYGGFGGLIGSSGNPAERYITIDTGSTTLLAVSAISIPNSGTATRPDIFTSRTPSITAAWQFDPDVSDTVYSSSVPSTPFANNLGNTAALTAMATAIVALDPAITWNGNVVDRAATNLNQTIDLTGLTYPYTVSTGGTLIDIFDIVDTRSDSPVTVSLQLIDAGVYNTAIAFVAQIVSELSVNITRINNNLPSGSSVTLTDNLDGTFTLAGTNVYSSSGNAAVFDSSPDLIFSTGPAGNRVERYIDIDLGTTTPITQRLVVTANTGTRTFPMLMEFFGAAVNEASTYIVEDYMSREVTMFTGFVGSTSDSDLNTVLTSIVSAINTNIETPIDFMAVSDTANSRIRLTAVRGGTITGEWFVTAFHLGTTDVGDLFFNTVQITDGADTSGVRVTVDGTDTTIIGPSEADVDTFGALMANELPATYDAATDTLEFEDDISEVTFTVIEPNSSSPLKFIYY